MYVIIGSASRDRAVIRIIQVDAHPIIISGASRDRAVTRTIQVDAIQNIIIGGIVYQFTVRNIS